MSSSPIALFFAQVTNAASTAAAGAAGASGTDAAGAAAQGPPAWSPFLYMIVIGAMVYFVMIRPQTQAKKKQEETIKGAKTGDKIVTTSGIHGVITNVKESTVILKIADNVKIEVEKSHIDKITRPDTSSSSEKPAAAKA